MSFRLLPLLLLASLVVLTSCEDKNPESTEPPQAGAADGSQDAQYVGLAPEEAEALAKQQGTPCRVTLVDGEPRPATTDYRPDRLNFEVQAGKIIKVTRG